MTVVELAKIHNWNLPTTCPVCGSELVINENHTKIKCTNEACKSKLIGRLEKWVDKLSIKELAATTLEKFIDAGFLNSVSDLYNLPYNKIAEMDGFGKRSAEIYKKNIEAANHARIATVIAGFNIDSVGEKVAQKVIDHIFNNKGTLTIKNIIDLNYTDFVCDGVGEITAKKLSDGLNALKEDILNITTKYISIDPEPVKNTNGKLAGLSFCFTGAMSLPRSQLEKMVIDNGGEVKGVSKNLSYLVAAELDTTSGKGKKARDLGIKMISPEDFLDMLK